MKKILTIAKRVFFYTAICALALFVTIALLLYSLLEKRPKLVPTATTHLYNQNYHSASNKVEEWLYSTYEETYRPSISIAVGIHGELVWAGAIGYSDIEKEVQATTSTAYPIGSISKAMTATALMKLHEDGTLDIDRVFHHYVKDFPAKKYEFTLKQLACHQSGIRSYQGGIGILGEMFNQKEYPTTRDAASLVEEDELLFEPGTNYRYSAFGYTLLSLAMENAARSSFETLMKESLFNPLSMKSTHFDVENRDLPNRAKEYILAKKKLFRTPSSNVSYKYAGGGMLSTPTDLVSIGNALLFDQYLKPETKEILWQPVHFKTGKNSEDYALGFNVGKVGKGPLGISVRHGGSTNGSFCYFAIFPENELVVAFMSNAKAMSNTLNRAREMERIGGYFSADSISRERPSAQERLND